MRTHARAPIGGSVCGARSMRFAVNPTCGRCQEIGRRARAYARRLEGSPAPVQFGVAHPAVPGTCVPKNPQT